MRQLRVHFSALLSIYTFLCTLLRCVETFSKMLCFQSFDSVIYAVFGDLFFR